MIATELLTKPKYTYQDYEKLPEGVPYQLIGGELVMSPAPTPSHQRVSQEINFELLKFVKEQKLGTVFYAPIDVYLAEAETYQPDIIFISRERANIIGEKKIEGAPDLVIEVLSPSTAYYDLWQKKHVYEAAGVKEYWLVDPLEQSMEVYENVQGQFQLVSHKSKRGRLESRLLPGFGVELAQIFAR